MVDGGAGDRPSRAGAGRRRRASRFLRGVRQTGSGNRSPRHLAPRIAHPRAQGAGTWSRSTRLGVACRCWPASSRAGVAASMPAFAPAPIAGAGEGVAGGAGGAAARAPRRQRVLSRFRAGRRRRRREHPRPSRPRWLARAHPRHRCGGDLARRPASPPPPAARFGARRRIAPAPYRSSGRARPPRSLPARRPYLVRFRPAPRSGGSGLTQSLGGSSAGGGIGNVSSGGVIWSRAASHRRA